MIWSTWKKGFDSWEVATARLLEATLRSPLVLGPAGSMLTAALRMKKMGDDGLARVWSRTGLGTRREADHARHLINQLESRLLDLEEGIGIGGSRSGSRTRIRNRKRKQGGR